LLTRLFVVGEKLWAFGYDKPQKAQKASRISKKPFVLFVVRARIGFSRHLPPDTMPQAQNFTA
jgi:hypothetical protein